MLIFIIKSELCCHKIKPHNRKSRELAVLRKGRWQLPQGHAGRDCTQAVHLLLGVVDTAQPFTVPSQLLSAHSEVPETPYPPTTERQPLVEQLLTWSPGTFRRSMLVFHRVV